MREEEAEHGHNDRQGRRKQELRGGCLNAKFTDSNPDDDPRERAENTEQGESARSAILFRVMEVVRASVGKKQRQYANIKA